MSKPDGNIRSYDKILNIVFNGLQPLSTNEMHKGNGRGLVKSDVYVQYEELIYGSMMGWKKDIAEFFSSYDEKIHCLRATITVEVPAKLMIVQGRKRKGCLNLTRSDAANCEKPLIDAVFYSLPVDDAHILENTQRQRVSKDENWKTSVKLEIIDLETIYEP